VLAPSFERSVCRELQWRAAPQTPEVNVPDDARPLLVFFYSQRSGPARRMESLLAHLARKERERLRVRRVDVEERPEIAERFRVREVPTLVLVRDRKVVARLEGRVSSPRIESMLEKHLPALEATAA
jgi:thioredoxin-like negative regulator of GroEL